MGDRRTEKPNRNDEATHNISNSRKQLSPLGVQGPREEMVCLEPSGRI